jgi:diguanylate cyclase (GGDEF)-like protein
VVEGRATGVLSVQSRRPAAYDAHQLSVLYTIGQQAAVAVENARHFEMATVDSVTGLYLRDYFFLRLEEEHGRACRYGLSFSILMTDLDGFKEVNDRYGYVVGDRFLRGVGDAVRGCLRAEDLACRYGGDEFCILLPETCPRGARIIAERVRGAIGKLAVDVEGLSVATTMSIGFAAFPDHEKSDLRSVIRKADHALYAAKRGGRDRVSAFAV